MERDFDAEIVKAAEAVVDTEADASFIPNALSAHNALRAAVNAKREASKPKLLTVPAACNIYHTGLEPCSHNYTRMGEVLRACLDRAFQVIRARRGAGSDSVRFMADIEDVLLRGGGPVTSPYLDHPPRTEAQAWRDRLATRHGVKVRTSFDHPPIPVRGCDWSAVTHDYEAWTEGDDWVSTHPVGQGTTEAEAIADLAEQLEDH